MKSANSQLQTVNYLLLDTSTAKAQIALADGENIFAKKSWDSFQNLSDKLLPEIESLLKQNNLKPENLKSVIVYLGPGTFTGLRIGITVANAFAYSLDIPISGVKGKLLGKEKFEIRELKPIDLHELLKKGLREMREKPIKGWRINQVEPFYGKEPNTRI